MQDVGMGDKAMMSFLGCCVQLLQILMEVTGVMVTIQCPLSFINFYVSKKIPEKKHGDNQCLAYIKHKAWSVKHRQCNPFFVFYSFELEIESNLRVFL